MATTKTDTYEAGRQAARLHLQAQDYTEVHVAKRRAAAHEEAGRKDVAAYWHGYALEVTLARMKRDSRLAAHRISWFGRSGSEWIPRNKHMRGRDWGWDARCSCGWETRTGGAIQERIREAVQDHRREALETH